MFCKHCGKEIDDDSKFCRFCGNELIDIKEDANSLKESCKKIVSLFRNRDIKPLFSFTFIGSVCIIGFLIYLFALTISSELLHTFGLSRGKQLNQDISSWFGIIIVVIIGIKVVISSIKSSDETNNQNK